VHRHPLLVDDRKRYDHRLRVACFAAQSSAGLLPALGHPCHRGISLRRPRLLSGPGGSTINTTGVDYVYVDPFAGNDSNFIGTDGNVTWISMVRLDGEPFPRRSFQASKMSNNGFSATTLRLTAFDDHGGFQILDFGLDSITDGNGGLEDFQTFTLTDPFFSRVAVVYFEGRRSPGTGRFVLDNLVVPEPAPAVLLLGGLLTLAARCRQRCGHRPPRFRSGDCGARGSCAAS
jgi:hypothetical protein